MSLVVTSFGRRVIAYPSNDYTFYNLSIRRAWFPFSGFSPGTDNLQFYPQSWTPQKVHLWAPSEDSTVMYRRSYAVSNDALEALATAGGIPISTPLDGLAWTVSGWSAERLWDRD